MSEVETLAKALYEERVAERGPAWEQLGDKTRNLWLEIAEREQFKDLA